MRRDLARVLDPSADIQIRPVTQKEEIFVNTLIQHINSFFQAREKRVVIHIEGAERDVRSLFSLPIIKAVWEKAKTLNKDTNTTKTMQMRMQKCSS